MEAIENQKTIANRRNALQSTGPKTCKGKLTASKNALKHGLLAKEVVLKEGDGKEDAKEFTTLLGSLHENYTPEGPIEEMLIERIAISYWRLRRAIRFETGMLREELDSLHFDYYNESNYVGAKPSKLEDLEALRAFVVSSRVSPGSPCRPLPKRAAGVPCSRLFTFYLACLTSR